MLLSLPSSVWEMACMVLTVATLYFFYYLLSSVGSNISMFDPTRNKAGFAFSYAWRHRLCGMFLLCWHMYGFAGLGWWCCGSGNISSEMSHYFGGLSVLYYDVVLGALGTITTLTAAWDFEKGHKFTTNAASGTLDADATVTYSEMMEHSFYQMLNLFQVLFLHAVPSLPSTSEGTVMRFGLAFLVALPWTFRGRFPVNAFQDNYNKGQYSWSLVSLMYRTKKYQYVFYKHFLLHGLNISVAISGMQVANSMTFRLYWSCLNLSYVMEFFLQTLVKKKYMQQERMLELQLVLMAVSSAAAVQVLLNVHLHLAILSVAMNFARRGKKVEVQNYLILMVAAAAHMYAASAIV